jgi:hypothetical protein
MAVGSRQQARKEAQLAAVSCLVSGSESPFVARSAVNQITIRCKVATQAVSHSPNTIVVRFQFRNSVAPLLHKHHERTRGESQGR